MFRVTMSRNFILLFVVTIQLPVPGHDVYISSLPRDTHVTQEQTVELHCIVEDRQPWERVFWAFRWQEGDRLWRYIHITDGHLTHEQIRDDIGRSHFVYRGKYSHRRVVRERTKTVDGISKVLKVENFTLQIDWARHRDSGLYMCSYNSDCPSSDVSRGSEVARVTVVAPENSRLLSCSCHSNGDPETRKVATKVTLTCTAAHELAVQELLLLRAGDGRPDRLNPKSGIPTNGTVVQEYTLQADDNGIEFYCKVDGPNDEVYCSQVPMFVPPTLTLTPASQTVYEGAEAVFTCTASGLPYIQSFTWYVGDTYRYPVIRDLVVSLDMNRGDYTYASSLRIKASDQIKRVVCVAAVPSGVSANETATLVVWKAERVQAVLSADGPAILPPQTSAYFTCSVLPSELTSETSFVWFVDGLRISNETSRGGLINVIPSRFDTFTAGSVVGSILRINDLQPSDHNITCQVHVPDLQAENKSYFISVLNQSDSTSTVSVAITIGVGGASFVVGVLSALLLFILCSQLPTNQVDISNKAEDLEEKPSQESSHQLNQIKEEQLHAEGGGKLSTQPSTPSNKQKSLTNHRDNIQHTYFHSVESQDSDTVHLGMQVNALSDVRTYEQIPEISPTRPNPPACSSQTPKNTLPLRTNFNEDITSPDTENRVSLKFLKLLKWPPRRDSKGFEIPSISSK